MGGGHVHMHVCMYVCMYVPKNRKHLSRCFWIGILITGTDAQVFSCPQGTLNASRPSGVEIYEVWDPETTPI